MPPRTNCSQPSYTEGNASGRQNRRCYACAATEPRLRKRLQVSDLEGAAAGIADQSTLQRLLPLTANLKLIVREVTHASRRVTAKPDRKTAAAAASSTSVPPNIATSQRRSHGTVLC